MKEYSIFILRKMVDLFGKDKGNISLSTQLQSYEDEDQKKLPTIINLQRTFYSIKIADIENRINRFDERNDELLNEIETTNEQTAIVDAETAEEIANLNKLLSTQNNLVESLKEKIDIIENDRIESKRLHEEKIELFARKYKKTKVELISQIKVLSVRINVLEDFKKVQDVLKEKFQANEVQMVENEKRIKETMEIINRKIEFDKEMVKNEMYDCLHDLAIQFQKEVNKHINLPNQRLMRENIMLKNELIQISTRVSSNIDTNIILKNAAIDCKKRMGVRTAFIRENIVIAKVQNEVLERLKKKFYNTKGYLSSINILDPEAEQKYLILIENASREENDINFRFSSLKAVLHKERTKISVARYILKKLECKIRALLETIYDLKYNAMCLLKCPSSRQDLITLSCIESFLFLKDLLIKRQLKLRSHIIKSSETIPQELESVSHIEDISENIDFEITADFIEEELSKETLDEMKYIDDVEEQKEISIEDRESQEPFIEDILKDTADFYVEN
ncbi:uncharacterized protein LOC132914575 [Bombus pascuorum]|uniref:uncharacterized protein LOC132914575 n=1 Tax=Bombus pascuorum TaxID=65598 RepID=UPI00298EA19F|nr:uncharacterized protein LOC132914575 [Bombus pascuorum]